MRFTGTFRAPEFKFSAYQAAVHAVLAEALAESTRQWLSATTAMIPCWSGASLATFVPLASLVNFQVAIDPVTRTRFSLGLNNATGEISSDKTSGVYTFTYSTSLAHLVWNEFHNANIEPDATKFPPPAELINPGPYHFQEAGKEAFDKFARTVELPSPLEFITSKEVRVR